MAFCYDRSTAILAIQYNQQAVSPTRFCSYFGCFGRFAQFAPYPVLQSDALKKFLDQTAKKIDVKIATPKDFEQLTDGDEFDKMIENMSNLYQSGAIEFVISARSKKSPLNEEECKGMVQRLLQRTQSEAKGNVKKLKAETVESSEPFDFLLEILREKEVLDLPNNDPQNAREQRISFVQRCFEHHLEHLRAVYAD